jgi:thiol:disulfide interchange protein DsbD
MKVSGNPLDFLLAFLGGVGVSLTPCMYPLIPITAGYIGLRARGSKIKALSLSLIYVTGIAITYSLLGLLASLGGRFFGSVSSQPITYIFVGIVVIVFGLSMLDLFQISLPNIIRLPTDKKQRYIATFFLGLTSGLIITPCLTPVLGTILVYLATKKNIFYGVTLLFSFAYGLGLILILIGTSSSILVSLPKSGKWMVYIKKLAGIILLGMGIYFISIAITRM